MLIVDCASTQMNRKNTNKGNCVLCVRESIQFRFKWNQVCVCVCSATDMTPRCGWAKCVNLTRKSRQQIRLTQNVVHVHICNFYFSLFLFVQYARLHFYKKLLMCPVHAKISNTLEHIVWHQIGTFGLLFVVEACRHMPKYKWLLLYSFIESIQCRPSSTILC